MKSIPIKQIFDEVPHPNLKLPLKDGTLYQFHTMIKPSGAQCNLDCTYCFYLHKEDLLNQPKNPRMENSLLELHIKQYIEAQTGPDVVFTWQGGEPTLMGLDFFKRVIAIQQKYKKSGQAVLNDLQTNGLLLDDEWCEFLKENNFLVGISIDGPAKFHDKYRYTKNKKPTLHLVMNAIERLRQHQITFNALCVVNRDNAKAPLEVYRFLRDEVKPKIIQFIPGIETTDFASTAPKYWQADRMPKQGSSQAIPGNPDSVVSEWSVESSDWGTFLTTIWDEWFQHDFGDIFVDQFENVISMMFGYGAQKCVNSEVCGKSVSIEHNGDIYACDHFTYPEYKLGNIKETHQGDLVFSEQQKDFGKAKSSSLPQYCQDCSHLKLCWGECPKNRFLTTPKGEQGLNYLCSGLKIFYNKAQDSYPVLKKRLSI